MTKSREENAWILYSTAFGEPRRKYTRGGAPKKRRAIPIAVRFYVLRRDRHTCQYCGAKAPDAALQVDHIRPRSRGGSDDHANLATACQDCNIGKGATPLDADLERLMVDRIQARSRLHLEGWLTALPVAGDTQTLLARLVAHADSVNSVEVAIDYREAALLRGLQATGYVEPDATMGAADIVADDDAVGLVATVTLRTWRNGRLASFGPTFPAARQIHG